MASLHWTCSPPGGVPGPIYYSWSQDNLTEIDRGWVIKASTLEELANKIRVDADNGGLMQPSILAETVKNYNRHWLAANMSTEAFMGFHAFNAKKITGRDVIDFVEYRRLTAQGKPVDEAFMEAVLAKPKGEAVR